MNRTTYKIVVSGLLIALSVVLTRIFSLDFMIAGVSASRLAIGSVPIMLAGILSGPAWGMAVGAVADVAGFFLFPKGAYYPLLTVTSALVGLLPGLMSRCMGKRTALWLKTLVSVSVTQAVCSMVLQTWFLSLSFGKAFEVLFLPRAIVALCMLPVYYLLVYSVLLGLERANLLPSRAAERRKG